MTYMVSAFSTLIGFLAADRQRVMSWCIAEGKHAWKGREGKGWRLFYSEALPRTWAVGGETAP